MVLSKEKKIISGGGDCVLKVWDIKDEKFRKRFEKYQKYQKAYEEYESSLAKKNR